MPLNLKKLTRENFKEGLYKVTPLQLSKASLYTYAGIMIGAFLSLITFTIAKQWGVAIIMFFVFLSQIWAVIAELQKIKALKESEAQINEALKQLEDINKGDETNGSRLK